MLRIWSLSWELKRISVIINNSSEKFLHEIVILKQNQIPNEDKIWTEAMPIGDLSRKFQREQNKMAG